MAKPINTNIVMPLSNQLSRRAALATPIGMAMTIIINMARTLTHKVTGMRSLILSITGLPSAENDCPKSSTASRPSQLQYCAYKG